MKLETHAYKFNTDVEAIQFFRDKVDQFPSGIIERVWADRDQECFVRDEKDLKPGDKRTIEYVVEGCSTYLHDGNWIVIPESGYARIMTDEHFKREYKVKGYIQYEAVDTRSSR